MAIKGRKDLNDRWREPFENAVSLAQAQFPDEICVDSNILCGTPCLRGTRIPIEMVLEEVAHSGTIHAALKRWPHLDHGQIQAAIRFAAVVVDYPYQYDDDPPAEEMGT